HHERYDGSGYPDGLSGENIPYLARIFQVVDVYDALSSRRPYKPIMSHEVVLRIMREEGTKGYWDPTILRVFLDIVEQQPALLDLPQDPGNDHHTEIFKIVTSAHRRPENLNTDECLVDEVNHGAEQTK
ncbi:MAG: hypothetical protein HQL49_07740, partial [Gammaproteobacteria bacterium]|nr:hypothetical protein [Gammaproteobacteria bacterium]